ncbi:hypothetical protein E4U22_003613, partial [Claviceps purpurea]
MSPQSSPPPRRRPKAFRGSTARAELVGFIHSESQTTSDPDWRNNVTVWGHEEMDPM